MLGDGDRTGWWTPVPYGVVPYGSIATTPAEMFVYGLSSKPWRSDGASVFVRIDPAVLVRDSRQLVVGGATVTLADDMTLLHTDYQNIAGVSGVSRAEISTPTGSCEIRSTYVGMAGGAPSFEPGASGRVWTRTVNSDRVEVECDDPATARTVALEQIAPPPVDPAQG